MKKLLNVFTAGMLIAACFSSCGVPKNSVHNADDLEGKIIGTQLGTTGYICAGDVADAKVEGYNKGAIILFTNAE